MPVKTTTKNAKATKSAKKAAKKVAPKKAAAKEGLGKRLVRTLTAMKAGKPLTHAEIAKATGKEKGNGLRELAALGLVTVNHPQEEGTRGFEYVITAKGKEALAK